MTLRQRFLKLVYPFFMWYSKPKKPVYHNQERRPPLKSFFDLKVILNNGQVLDLATMKGKKVMLVNTASDCGYTTQYEELERFYKANYPAIEVIAFPANDFKSQEQRNDEEIARFCQLNFGISFPIAKKSAVKKSPEQNPVFQWLSDKQLNGWNNKAPIWNFTKFIVNEEGVLTHYFHPSVSPLSKEIKQAVEETPFTGQSNK